MTGGLTYCEACMDLFAKRRAEREAKLNPIPEWKLRWDLTEKQKQAYLRGDKR